MKKKLFVLLLLIFFLNQVLWAQVVPLWQTPDEQAHFAEVAFLAEKGKLSKGYNYDLSEEIRKSEELLGTERDARGNNKFTFHPDYRIEYTKSYIGKYEQKIISLADTEARKLMVKQETPHYPPFYYLMASSIYKIFYNYDLFTRVFAIRILFSFITVLIGFFAYKIGLEIFSANSSFAFLLAILAVFQPMISFTGAGVSSDNLAILFFTLFNYLAVLMIKRGLKLNYLFYLVIIVLTSVYTKPQFFLLVPLLGFLVFLVLLRDLKNKYKYLWAALILIGSSIIWFLMAQFRFGPAALFFRFMSTIDIGSFVGLGTCN